MSHISNIIQKKKERRFAWLKITAIIFALVFFSFPVLANDRIYDITLSLTKWDEVNVRYAKVTDGYLSTVSTIEQPYKIALVSTTGEELYSNYLYVGFTILSSLPQDIEMNTTTLYLRIPYKEDAKAIKLMHNNKEIFSFDTAQFCTVNRVCDTYENEISCPQDCRPNLPDTYCNSAKNGICDPDCTDNADPDCQNQSTSTPAESCGNGVCESSESVISCPKDCKSESPANETPLSCGDGICGNRENDITCPQDCKKITEPVTVPQEEKSSLQWILFVVFIVLIIIVVIVMYLRMRQPKAPEQGMQQ